MLRFSSGMIPLGSLSWENIKYVSDGALHTGNNGKSSSLFAVTEKLSCTHCGVLKVVQTVVCEDEPPPLPGFNSSPCGANIQRQRGSAREKARETSTEAPGRAADRQTDVWADRQMTAPEDIPAIHPDPPLHHAHTITTTALPSALWLLSLTL